MPRSIYSYKYCFIFLKLIGLYFVRFFHNFSGVKNTQYKTNQHNITNKHLQCVSLIPLEGARLSFSELYAKQR